MENEKKVESVIILGGGPAGFSAALYAARAELNPLVFTGIQPGGQAALTHTIENYPGYPEGIGGSELGDLFQKQAERFGAKVEFDSAMKVDFSQRPFWIKTYGKEYLADSVIIATGASSNLLNVPGEKEFTGRGTSYCATCDGWFFKGKEVVVVGGGDSALEEAIFLTRYATRVTIIHRRDEFRAGNLLQKRVRENPKIDLKMDSVVKEILGDDKVNAVRIENVKTGKSEDFKTEGVFIFVGHTPNTKIFEGQLKMDARGYIEVDKSMQTSIEGIFAAGEAADPDYRQVITSAGMGAAAAIQAGRYLEHMKK